MIYLYTLPGTAFNMPQISVPLLKGYLKECKIKSKQYDLTSRFLEICFKNKYIKEDVNDMNQQQTEEGIETIKIKWYQKIANIYRCNNVECLHIPLDEEGIDPDLLARSNADILHISPSHHYPTGIVLPISSRYELLGWASKNENHYIIEDDYDSELRLSGQPIPTLQSIDVSDKVIYMNTFTNTLSSTVRISYMVLPGQLLDEFYKKLSFYSCTVSNFEQYTLAKFIQEGYFEKHINRLRNYYHSKRDTLITAIRSSRLNESVTISGEEAGVHFLMEINTSQPEETLIQSALTQGIRLSPLSAYYHIPQEAPDNVYIMNYSSIEIDNIKEIIQKLSQCIYSNSIKYFN